MTLQDPDYKLWLTELKGKIRTVQIKAAIAVNSALIQFYWELGKMIGEQQTVWGSKFLENLSKDLQDEFPQMKGFSVSNLKTCKLFFAYFSSQIVSLNETRDSIISSQAVNQIKNTEYKSQKIDNNLLPNCKKLKNKPMNHSNKILDYLGNNLLPKYLGA